jgi:hypothetical protein
VCRLEIKIPESTDVEKELTDAGFEDFDYEKRWRRYRVRLTQHDVSHKRDFLLKLMKMAYANRIAE